MTYMFSVKPRGASRGAGIGRVLAIDSIKNSQGSIFNKFVAGAGVGATSTFARRAKINHASAKRQTYNLTNCVYKIVI
jgi:hypothetical protein